MKQTYISFEEYKGHVAELCRQVYLSGWQPDYVVGITRGGLLPATMISHYLDVPCHTLNVSLRDHENTESNTWMAEDAFGYPSPMDEITGEMDYSTAMNILIVDDMNDSGATLEWIKNDWQSSCFGKDPRWDNIWGNNVRTAVIINNQTSSFKDVDYSAVEVNKDEDPQWIVFPYEEWWK